MKTSHHHPNRALSQKEMEARRLKAVPYFKKEWSERHIAKNLGVSGPSIHEWKIAWKERGVEGLKAGHYGRSSCLSKEKERIVKRNILKGAEAHGFSGDYWTLRRVTKAIEKWTRVTYEDRSVWHLLKRLGFSCQKPVRRAVERDEEAIRTWTQEIWPQIKKGASKTA